MKKKFKSWIFDTLTCEDFVKYMIAAIFFLSFYFLLIFLTIPTTVLFLTHTRMYQCIYVCVYVH